MVSVYDLVERAIQRLTVDANGCWVWPGALNQSGVGICNARIDGRPKTFAVHRIVWESFNGPLSPRYRLSRTCNNVRCINPAHYVAPTAKDDTGGMAVFSTHTRQRQSATQRQLAALNRTSRPNDAP